MFIADLFGGDLVIVVIVLAVVLFGGAAIPKLARSLGSAKTEFEKGVKQGGSTSPDATAAESSDESSSPS